MTTPPNVRPQIAWNRPMNPTPQPTTAPLTSRVPVSFPVVAVLLMIALAACSGDPSVSSSAGGADRSIAPSTVIPSQTPKASERPSTDASPSSSARPGVPIAPPKLAVGDWVVTTIDGLRLRGEPGLDGASVGLLRAGYVGTVIDGPVALDGHEWIHVAWPGLPAGSGCATGPDSEGFLSYCGASGWLATADENGNSWVTASEPDCPQKPATVAAASGIQPGVRLACFGAEELTLAGFIAPEALGRGCYPGFDHEPAWLGYCAVAFLQGEESQFDGTTYELPVNVHPDIGTCEFGGTSPESCPFIAYVGRWVRVTGMLDHPAAASCVIRPWEGNEHAPDPASAVYACRERFVVTAIETGTAP